MTDEQHARTVDKRIGDVALAIQLGATVYDLEEAELRLLRARPGFRAPR